MSKPKEVARREGEFRTDRLVWIHGGYFHVDANGGERGAWQNGSNKAAVVSPTEAHRLALSALPRFSRATRGEGDSRHLENIMTKKALPQLVDGLTYFDFPLIFTLTVEVGRAVADGLPLADSTIPRSPIRRAGVRGLKTSCERLGLALAPADRFEFAACDEQGIRALHNIQQALEIVEKAVQQMLTGGPAVEWDTPMIWLGQSARGLWECLPASEQEKVETPAAHTRRLWGWPDDSHQGAAEQGRVETSPVIQPGVSGRREEYQEAFDVVKKMRPATWKVIYKRCQTNKIEVSEDLATFTRTMQVKLKREREINTK